MIRKLDSTQDDFQETLDALLAFEAETDDAIEGAVAKIIADVRARGDEAVLHSSRFVLVDAEGRVRGTYDVRDAEAMLALRGDLRRLRDLG